MEQDNSIFGSLREGIPADFGANGSVMYGIRPDPVTGLYDFNDAKPQLPENDTNPQGRDRYVRTDDARRMVQGREAEIVRALGIPWNGRQHIRCPYIGHDDYNPSWRLMDDGHAVCTCRGGRPHSVFDVISEIEGCDFEAAKLRAAEIVGALSANAKPNSTANRHAKPDRRHDVADILRGRKPLAGSKGEKYLVQGRGVGMPQNTDDIQYHDSLTDWAGKRGRPAIVSTIRDPLTGKPTGGIHRLYLSEDGLGKADMPQAKMTLGPSAGVIMLSPMRDDGSLGIAEGLETALAAMTIFGVPTWSGVSAGGVARFGEDGFPAGLKKLFVFGDHGEAGEAAANDLYHRAAAAGIEVAVYLPLGGTETGGKLSDFNDDLLAGHKAGDYAALKPVNSPPDKPDIPDNAALQRSAIQLIDFEDMEPRIKDRSIIHHILNEGEISGLVGASSTGKTFLALDMGLHVAAGRDWFGHTTRQMGVIYVAAEAGPGIMNRVAAFTTHYEMPPKTKLPFAVVVSPVDLRQPSGHTNDLIAAIHAKERERGFRVGLVIIDTLNRAMAGGDENRSDDMGAFIGNVDRLRDATGAHILIVHHLGKNPKNGARGHSSFHAALDTEILVERDNKMGISTAAATKQRELPLGGQINFKLASIELGRDQYDRPVTSCIVEPTDEVAGDGKKSRLPPKQQRALDLLVDEIARHGQIPPPNERIPSNTRCVLESVWRERCYAGQISNSTKQDSKLKAFTRAAEGLMAKHLVSKHGDWVWVV